MKTQDASFTDAPFTDAGFTLLELLVAIVVLGVIIGTLAQGLQFGLRAQDIQSTARARRGDLEAVDTALRHLVAHADPGRYPEPASLRGTAQTMAFTTTLPLHGPGQAQEADVTLAAEAGQLVLRWRPRRHVTAFAPPPPAETTSLLDGVTRLDLAYQGADGRWAATWSGERLPVLVRLGLVFDPRSQRRWPPILVAPLREAFEQ